MDKRIAIICGGPSEERGVSLNSARSFLDHTSSFRVQVIPFYMNTKGEFYQLTEGQLYSNTPSDFDFKVKEISSSLDEKALIERLKNVDLVFPIIHGIYGEDGTLQELLEKHKIPFIGSSSGVCKSVFDKYQARKLLEKKGYPVIPFRLIGKGDIEIDFFCSPAIIKPTKSGSSIGVTYVESKEEAKKAIKNLWNKGFDELLIEPYCKHREFTLCVMENKEGASVSLIPLEIELVSKKDKILDYRKKYLPTDQIRYHCPARFSKKEIQAIREMAEALFQDLGFRDFARMDGWISEEGKIYFSDFNPISGMEQNSFLFQQVAQIGLSHADFFEHLLKCESKKEKSVEKEKVYVLMGGSTAERQVSLMSGTNVWLKLLQDTHYEATPFLLDTKGDVWELPYAYTLHHTVDELEERCRSKEKRDLSLINEIRENLSLPLLSDLKKPKHFSLFTFIEKAKKNQAFVFIALHGGMGEDGTIQKRLEEEGIFFNGSDSSVSSLCMDKYQTALAIQSIQDPTILAIPQISIDVNSLETEEILWKRAISYFKTEDLLIKPRCDGCSAGVARISSLKDLESYFLAVRLKERQIPPNTLSYQDFPIEMPLFLEHPFLLEPFIQTDKIYITDATLHYEKVSGWCEITLGIFEKLGEYTALNPSITIAKNHTLSLEEKFQGGTGVNLTPPPREIIPSEILQEVQKKACTVALKLGIKNYARLDLFVECATGRIQVIEANTLPALTPSTVLYHQAISLTPPLFPKDLLSKVIQDAKQAFLLHR